MQANPKNLETLLNIVRNPEERRRRRGRERAEWQPIQGDATYALGNSPGRGELVHSAGPAALARHNEEVQRGDSQEQVSRGENDCPGAAATGWNEEQGDRGAARAENACWECRGKFLRV